MTSCASVRRRGMSSKKGSTSAPPRCRGIGLGHPVDILGPGLLRHAQEHRADRLGQKRDGGGHDGRTDPRALAAAEDQKAHRAVARRHVGRAGPRQDRGAHRIAGMLAIGARPRAGSWAMSRRPPHRPGARKAGSPGPARRSVRGSRGPPRQPGRGQGRDRRDSRRSPPPARAVRAASRVARRGDAGKRCGTAPAPWPARRPARRWPRPPAAPSPVWGKPPAYRAPRASVDSVTRQPAHHRLGQRLRGEHVPAGAACRDDQMQVAWSWRVAASPRAGMPGEQDIADIALWTGAGETQHHAHRNARRDQRRPAIADKRQRHSLGRQQSHRDAQIDERLQGNQRDEPRNRQAG
jgi:hypothetical protein